MKKDVLDFVIEKTHELINSPTCSKETKEAANAWLSAVENGKETEETQRYIAELEEDIMPVDTLIAFAESDAGAQVFGADKAKDVAAHARDIKSNGAEYCDCPACAAAAAILEIKDQL
ncbi:molecular chaperone Hsp90 [Anaerostipes sp.]|uniref:molecular chaperone Hsp90 n=1 Tax=Anaerostipes sp. TaxID=1872530 RepID=UPI0025B84FD7|nr:molecular chaperone Hsp90 [Anaerostipes sp.]MBS7008501.1 molecular chaperone Hsp90 [Anaerostipes sp.]